ncbi:MAG TPA: hypothetical protein VNZ52_05425 [Candidatus Thermoplasmatota archaeon]|nr:hypothetical protein [Candidatus Thermoplasmatota archaeon]
MQQGPRSTSGKVLSRCRRSRLTRGGLAALLVAALLLPGCLDGVGGGGAPLKSEATSRAHPHELLATARAAAAGWSPEAFLVSVAATDNGPWKWGRPDTLDGRNRSWTFTFVSERHATELRAEVAAGGRLLFLDERPLNADLLEGRGFDTLAESAIPGPEALDLPRALAPVQEAEDTARFLSQPLGSLEYKLLGPRGWVLSLTREDTSASPRSLIAYVATDTWDVESLQTF